MRRADAVVVPVMPAKRGHLWSGQPRPRCAIVPAAAHAGSRTCRAADASSDHAPPPKQNLTAGSCAGRRSRRNRRASTRVYAYVDRGPRRRGRPARSKSRLWRRACGGRTAGRGKMKTQQLDPIAGRRSSRMSEAACADIEALRASDRLQRIFENDFRLRSESRPGRTRANANGGRAEAGRAEAGGRRRRRRGAAGGFRGSPSGFCPSTSAWPSSPSWPPPVR